MIRRATQADLDALGLLWDDFAAELPPRPAYDALRQMPKP